MWFDCRHPRESSTIRAFCLPYAGGDRNVFHSWEKNTPPFIEVHTLTLPGRGNRRKEVFETDLGHVACQLARQVHAIAAEDEKPFFFVGFGLGALIAFEVCRALQSLEGSVAPIHTFLAGHVAPACVAEHWCGEIPIYKLNGLQFRAALQKYGMLNEQLVASDVTSDFLSIMQSDLTLYGSYKFRPLGGPIAGDLTLFAASRDAAAPDQQMGAWGPLFRRTVTHVCGDLGHGFLFLKAEDLRERITRKICFEFFKKPWPVQLVKKSIQTPDLPAVSLIGDENRVSHLSLREFIAEAHALASWMYEVGGARQGDRVLLVAESSYASFLCMLACGLMGVVYAPCPPDTTEADLANRLKNLAPAFILLCEDVEINLKHPVYKFKDVDYKSWIGLGRYNDIPFEDVKLEDPCFIAHTSGSTGLPKPIVMYHKNILNNLLWRSYAFPMRGPADCYGVSIFWFWYFFIPLLNDYRVAPIPQPDMLNVDSYLDKMLALNVTHIEITPSYAKILSSVGKEHQALKNLSLMILMGEVLHLSTVKQLMLSVPSCRLCNVYSLSETNDITYCFLTKAFLRHIDSQCPNITAAPIGTPAWNVDIFLRRGDGSISSIDHVLQTVEKKEMCEMYVKSEELMIRGYMNNKRATNETLIISGGGEQVFRCNDLVTVLQPGPGGARAGVLVVTGRADRTVNVRGKRVGLDHVTARIKRLPEVKDCALLWDSDTQQLFCFTVLEDGDVKDSQHVFSLREQLKNVLTQAEIPNQFLLLPELPLNKRTKPDLRKLRECIRSAQQKQIRDSTAPEGKHAPLISLSGLVHDVLGPAEVFPERTFSEIGGDSLKGAKLIAKAKEMGLGITTELLYGYTLGEIANILEHKDSVQEVDFAAEAQVPDRLRKVRREKGGSAILLTGCTGFMGPVLLEELVRAHPSATIFCHVRCTSREHGAKRLGEIAFHPGIRILPGDLTKPRLGVEESDWESLVREVGWIIHNGAWVSHVRPYRALKACNVGSTVDLVELALQTGAYLSFVSSTLAITNLEDVTIDPKLLSDPRFNGYGQTKAVCEMLLQTCRRELGLSLTIVRPGHISPHSQTGYLNEGDFWTLFMRACIAVGEYPRNTSYSCAWTPVDRVAQTIVESRLPEVTLIGSGPPLSSLLSQLPLRSASVDHWASLLAALPDSHPAFPLRHEFIDVAGGEFRPPHFAVKYAYDIPALVQKVLQLENVIE